MRSQRRGQWTSEKKLKKVSEEAKEGLIKSGRSSEVPEATPFLNLWEGRESENWERRGDLKGLVRRRGYNGREEKGLHKLKPAGRNATPFKCRFGNVGQGRKSGLPGQRSKALGKKG